VGCGAGSFLARMRARGWEVQGQEFDAAAAAAAATLGIPVHTGPLSEAGFPPRLVRRRNHEPCD